jgi:CBS domain-containing protein
MEPMDGSRGPFATEVRDHSTARVPVMSPSQSVAEARSYMAGKSFDVVDEIALLDQGRLVGLVTLSALLESSGERPLSDLAGSGPAVIRPGESEGGAARSPDGNPRSDRGARNRHRHPDGDPPARRAAHLDPLEALTYE